NERLRKAARRNWLTGSFRLAGPAQLARCSRIANDDVETQRTSRGECLAPSRYRSAEQTPPITPRAWRDGLADQTVVNSSVDPRSLIERCYMRISSGESS